MVLLILIFKITWLLNNMNKLQSMWYFGKSEVNSFHRKRRNHYFLRIKGLSTQGHRIDIVRVGAWEDYSGHLGLWYLPDQTRFRDLAPQSPILVWISPCAVLASSGQGLRSDGSAGRGVERWTVLVHCTEMTSSLASFLPWPDLMRKCFLSFGWVLPLHRYAAGCILP